jgi:predicted ArsR family transcriptional regulator
MAGNVPSRRWTFLTNHAHVLLCIAANPDARIRDIAEQVGITERAAHRIVTDLGKEGYISATKVGRRNTYQVHAGESFRHPMLREHEIGELVDLLRREEPSSD